MSGWLARAKEALSGREADAAPELLEIACPCGRKVEATRRRDFQRVLCKGCGEPFFLLPLDVFPRPVMKVRKVKPPKVAPSKKAKSSEKSVVETAPETARDQPGLDLQTELIALLVKVRGKLTPLRMIVLSLVAVLALTGWWQWNLAARSHAEVDFKSATEAGSAALQKSDFLEAAQHFGRAAEAADVLGRTDVAAEQARQRYRQLTAINSLLGRSLTEVIEAATNTRRSEDAAAAESEFANLHSGRWLVLQSEITPRGSAATSQNPAWEQRMQFGEETLWLTAALPVFAKVQAGAAAASASATNPDASSPANVATASPTPLNDLGQHPILFAAQAESLKWDAQKSAWTLKLKSASGFLWTDYDLLLAVGIAPDELWTEGQLRGLLLEQSRWIGAAE